MTTMFNFNPTTGYAVDSSIMFSVGLQAQPLDKHLFVNSIKTAFHYAIKLGVALKTHNLPPQNVIICAVNRFDLTQHAPFIVCTYANDMFICQDANNNEQYLTCSLASGKPTSINGVDWVKPIAEGTNSGEDFVNAYTAKIKKLKRAEVMSSSNSFVLTETTIRGIYKALANINNHFTKEITQRVQRIVLHATPVNINERVAYTNGVGSNLVIHMTNYHPHVRDAYVDTLYQYAVATYMLLMNESSSFFSSMVIPKRLTTLLYHARKDKNLQLEINFNALNLYCTPKDESMYSDADMFALFYTHMIMANEKDICKATLLFDQYLDEFIQILS